MAKKKKSKSTTRSSTKSNKKSTARKTESKAKRSSKKTTTTSKSPSRSSKSKVAKAPQSPQKKSTRSTDDLTLIEGIGPKIAKRLSENKIDSFAKLAKSSIKTLRGYLTGPGFSAANPTSWPLQAELAAEGDWAELDILQNQLHAGRGYVGPEHRREPVALLESGRAASASRPFPFEKIASEKDIQREFDERSEELQENYELIKRLCQKTARRLKSGIYGRVSGVEVGLRRKFGRIVHPIQYVITVKVPYKLTLKRLKQCNIAALPESLEGVQIKVTESRPYLLSDEIGNFGINLEGDIVPEYPVFPTHASNFEQTKIIGGIPTSEQDELESWGTIGLCVNDGSDDFAIVNAHFADENGEDMVQPPSELDNAKIGEIVKVEYLTPVENGGTIDAALIELNSNRGVEPFKVISEIENQILETEEVLVAVNRLDGSVLNKPVFKFGARTQRTEGFIENPNLDGLVVNGITTENIIQISNRNHQTIVDNGDSGSGLIMQTDDGDLVAVGIMFAGDRADSSWGYACHMADVVKKFGLEIPIEKTWTG